MRLIGRGGPAPERGGILHYAMYGSVAAALAAALVCVALAPGGHPAPFVPCPFHALTGLYCPGCGMFRMLYYLVHWQVGAAFSCNPLGFAVLICMAAVWGLRRFPRGRALVAKADRFAVTRALLVAVVAFWALRNIPVFPFTLLAPLGAFA